MAKIFVHGSLLPCTYRKKPVEVEAMRWDGTNFNAIKKWAGDNVELRDGELIVKTLEDGKDGQAVHAATEGDFVIKGVRGEFYFCKPDIFYDTYEKV